MGLATTFAAGRRLTAAQLNLKPYFHVYQIVVQSLADATDAAITFTAEIVDTMGAHSNSVQTTRVTPTVAGFYGLKGRVMFDVNINGDRGAHFRKNGNKLDGANYGSAPALNGAGFLYGSCTCEATIFCNGTTDYIELWGAQNRGGALNTAYNANGASSYIIGEWKSP